MDGSKRILVHAMALKLFDSQEHGFQWHVFEDGTGFIPLHGLVTNGPNINLSENISRYLHGAYRVTVFVPAIREENNLRFTAPQDFPNEVLTKMKKWYVHSNRQPLGFKVGYQQQKELLRQKMYFEQMQ